MLVRPTMLLLLLHVLLCPNFFAGRVLLEEKHAFTCPALVSWYASHPELPRPEGGLPVCYPEEAKADLDGSLVGFDVDETFDFSQETTNLNRKGCELDRIKSALVSAIQPRTPNSRAGFVVRLAFHQAGTFNSRDNTGGVNGAAVRLRNEIDLPQNVGLREIIQVLDGVRDRFPGCITRADLYTLAGAVAVESSGGPSIKWRPGRVDYKEDFAGPLSSDEVGRRLPNPFFDFNSMERIARQFGISIEEMVALMGGHTLGRVRFVPEGKDRSWTNEHSFTNRYYQELIEDDFPTTPTIFRVDTEGRHQFMNVDLALLDNPHTKQIVHKFAKDQGAFFSAFASVWSKFLELGAEDILNNFQNSGRNNNNNNNHKHNGGGGGNNGGSAPLNGHPVCKGQPSHKAYRDSQGRLWGWESNVSCMYPSGGQTPESPTGPNGHPVCKGAPGKNAHRDNHGRLWGYEGGRSCAYTSTYDGLTSDLFDLGDEGENILLLDGEDLLL